MIVINVDIDKKVDILSENITIQVSKDIYGSVNYRLNIKNGEVKDYDIDLESFYSYIGG